MNIIGELIELFSPKFPFVSLRRHRKNTKGTPAGVPLLFQRIF